MKQLVPEWTRYWKYTILKEIESKKDRYFECKCDCWNIKNVRLSHLKNWSIKSCWKCPSEQIIRKCNCWKDMLLFYYQKNKIFCSLECRINSTKNRYTYNCKVCWISKEVPLSRINKNRECCSSSCRSILLQSRLHNNVIEDYKERRVFINWELRKKRKDNEYKKWRKECLKRDWNKCCNCWKEAECVHHIKQVKDFPDLILEISNGLSLCKICHNNIHNVKKDNRPI